MHLEAIYGKYEPSRLRCFLPCRRCQADVSPALAGGRQTEWNAHTAALSDMNGEYCMKMWRSRLGLRTDKDVVGGKSERRGAPVNLYHSISDICAWATT